MEKSYANLIINSNKFIHVRQVFFLMNVLQYILSYADIVKNKSIRNSNKR